MRQRRRDARRRLTRERDQVVDRQRAAGKLHLACLPARRRPRVRTACLLGRVVARDGVQRGAEQELIHLADRQRLQHVIAANHGEPSAPVLAKHAIDFLGVGLRIVLAHRFKRRSEHLVLRCGDVEPQHVDYTLVDQRREVLAQQRQNHLVACKDDVLHLVVADDPLERVDDFLRVLMAVIIDMPLIAALGPAALRRVRRLDAGHFLLVEPPPESEHEEPCCIRISDERSARAILIRQPRPGGVRASPRAEPFLTNGAKVSRPC